MNPRLSNRISHSLRGGRSLDNMMLFLCLALFATSIHLTVGVSDEDLSKDWWQTTVFYQIYPRSFMDSDGDGIGDLKGITQNMEHFVDAGVGVIWLSPIYKSPMVDFGYDISDFRGINPEYGTMEDFTEMTSKAHELGLRVVLDFVPNHASNESEYFKLSLNKTEGYEDFFIWDDGLTDPNNSSARLPPTNWVSQFQGSAWEWRDERQQFYLHQFAIQQADLNYRNPVVREEMKGVLKYWLERGVSGFRIDACPYLIEADKKKYGGRYPNDPISGTPGYGPGQLGYTLPYYTKDLDESYDVVYEWKEFLNEYANSTDGVTRVMMIEGYANISRTMKFYGTGSREGSNIPFNFDFITQINGNSSARDFVYTALRWLTYVPQNKTPNWVFGNHDNSRMATRFGHHMVDGLNMLDLLLPGVAITYQGDEIGMEDGYVSWEDTVDIQACVVGKENYMKFSRDPERTPFQWNNSTNSGFSNASKTWLPVAQNYKELNLENQKLSDKSHFKVYQALTELRKHPTIQSGDWNIKPLNDEVLALKRSLDTYDTFVMVMNLSENSEEYVDLEVFSDLPDTLIVYISSYNSSRDEEDTVEKDSLLLQPGESLVLIAPAYDEEK